MTLRRLPPIKTNQTPQSLVPSINKNVALMPHFAKGSDWPIQPSAFNFLLISAFGRATLRISGKPCCSTAVTGEEGLCSQTDMGEQAPDFLSGSDLVQIRHQCRSYALAGIGGCNEKVVCIARGLQIRKANGLSRSRLPRADWLESALSSLRAFHQ